MDDVGDGVAWLVSGLSREWARRQLSVLGRKAGAVPGWVRAHLFGVVVTAVSLTFVAGLVVTLALSGEDVWAIAVAMVGFPAIAGSIGYHWGGTA